MSDSGEQAIFRPTYDELVEEYSLLLALCARMIDALRGTKVDDNVRHLHECEAFALKLFAHLATILRLSEAPSGTNPAAAYGFVDHSSAMVVTRAALEAYALCAYLFVPDADRNEEELRRAIWKLFDLAKRQDFPATASWAKEQIKKDGNTISKIRASIEANPAFKTRKPKQRKRLLEATRTTEKGFVAIGEDVGFHPLFYGSVYSLLCSYSHSGSLSISQMRSVTDMISRQQMMRVCLGAGLTIMSAFTAIYAQLFPRAARVLASDVAGRQLAERWRHEPDLWAISVGIDKA